MSVSYPNQLSVHFCVGLCLESFLSNFKLDSRAGKGPLGLDQGSGSAWGPCAAEIKFLRDKFANKSRAGPAGESGTVKQVRSQDLGRCARQAESMEILAGPVCLCVLENSEGVREKVGREESGAVLLTSLRAIYFITPNNTIITVPNILSTVQNFGISKYH